MPHRVKFTHSGDRGTPDCVKKIRRQIRDLVEHLVFSECL